MVDNQHDEDDNTPVEWSIIGLILKLIIFGGILIGAVLTITIGAIIWLISLII